MSAGAHAFGIARSIDPIRSRARLAELCELMIRDVGGVVMPHHADSYRRLAEDFESGRVAVAWMPPLLCIELEKRSECAETLLPVRGGAVSYYSALVARRGKGPASLADVKRAIVAWVDPESSSGYLVPRLHLQAQGRALAALFGGELMLGSHAAVLDAVESGRADVGATYCASKAPRWTSPAGAERPLGALTITGAIPNDALVLSPRLPPELCARITRWLLVDMPPRARALTLELMGASHFRAAQPGHFAPLRRILTAAAYTN
jgi:ABC-type phosphate/phosphonate transport system substrate-binding protein